MLPSVAELSCLGKSGRQDISMSMALFVILQYNRMFAKPFKTWPQFINLNPDNYISRFLRNAISYKVFDRRCLSRSMIWSKRAAALLEE